MTHIVVAGAGIAGLATGIGLARVGVRVTLTERRTILDDGGAGLQLSPNATRCLDGLGLLDAVRSVATEPDAVRIRRADNNACVSLLPLGDAARARFGFPFLVLHRSDLRGVLLSAVAAESGIALACGIRVEGASETGAGVRVETVGTAGRRTIETDGFVAADGVFGSTGVGASRHRVSSGRLAWRALVPAAVLPDTFLRPESNLWLGTRTHMVHYPVRSGTLVNVVVITEDDIGTAGPTPDRWAQPGDPDRLRRHLAGWHAEPRRLIDAASAWRIWPLYDGSSKAGWTQGCRTAVGDAAHPMLPFLAQGASQAIEDAATLGATVARHPGSIATAFQAYEALRRPRAAQVQTASRRQGRIYHLGDPMARARDLAMRLLGPNRVFDRLQWLYGTELHGP